MLQILCGTMCLLLLVWYINLPSEYHVTDGLLYHLLHVAATTTAASFQENKCLIDTSYRLGNLIEIA